MLTPVKGQAVRRTLSVEVDIHYANPYPLCHFLDIQCGKVGRDEMLNRLRHGANPVQKVSHVNKTAPCVDY
jgi:hypothetical protein